MRELPCKPLLLDAMTLTRLCLVFSPLTAVGAFIKHFYCALFSESVLYSICSLLYPLPALSESVFPSLTALFPLATARPDGQTLKERTLQNILGSSFDGESSFLHPGTFTTAFHSNLNRPSAFKALSLTPRNVRTASKSRQGHPRRRNRAWR